MIEDFGDTFVDEDGEYGEPGTEYVFHPGKAEDQTRGDSEEDSGKESRDGEDSEPVETQASLTDQNRNDDGEFLMKDGELV